MTLLELLLLAVGLSMDAFAVSICKGLAMRRATFRAGMTCGIWFGGFQALMPLIGFFLGTLFADVIRAIDHWVAFVLLGLIGANMLKEGFAKKEEGEADGKGTDMSIKTMFVLAVATSIYGRQCGYLDGRRPDWSLYLFLLHGRSKNRQCVRQPV